MTSFFEKLYSYRYCLFCLSGAIIMESRVLEQYKSFKSIIQYLRRRNFKTTAGSVNLQLSSEICTALSLQSTNSSHVWLKVKFLFRAAKYKQSENIIFHNYINLIFNLNV